MKKPAWSHSSLKDFEGCQRRYHEVKVLKKYPFTETEAALGILADLVCVKANGACAVSPVIAVYFLG